MWPFSGIFYSFTFVPFFIAEILLNHETLTKMLTDVQTDGRTSPIYRPELLEQSGQKLNTGVFARLSITATPKIKSQTINKLLLYKINKVSEIKINKNSPTMCCCYIT